MSIESNISDAINSLRLANEELLAKRDELWDASDAIKLAGGDWVPTNHAGKSCESANGTTESLLVYMTSHLDFIPKMLLKHGINSGDSPATEGGDKNPTGAKNADEGTKDQSG